MLQECQLKGCKETLLSPPCPKCGGKKYQIEHKEHPWLALEKGDYCTCEGRELTTKSSLRSAQ